MNKLRYSLSPLIIWLCFSVAAPAADPEPIHSLLDRTGKSVEKFFQQFTSVACTELVKQEKLSSKEKVLYRQQTNYDYMIFMDFHGNELSVEESRLEQKQLVKNDKPKNLPLLIANGFSTLELIFHPFYQGSFEFKRLADDNLDGIKCGRISFRHLPGTRSTTVLRRNDADYPLNLQGIAWIDLESGEIRKITANLESPMEDLNLRQFSSDVKYTPIKFPGGSEEYWLPSEASIYVETPHQRWRNVHRFLNYKLFSVNTESKVSAAK